MHIFTIGYGWKSKNNNNNNNNNNNLLSSFQILLIKIFLFRVLFQPQHKRKYMINLII